MTRSLSLFARNLLFTLVVPGSAGVWVPWWIADRHGHVASPAQWAGTAVIAAGAVLYLWCIWNFAVVGQGTPGPWDAPRQVVATGPFRWVRNPLYLAALLVVLGQAWLFWSLTLLIYAAAMAVTFHLFVLGYEEPTLRGRFGNYPEYQRAVPRWIPRPPRQPDAAAGPGQAAAG